MKAVLLTRLAELVPIQPGRPLLVIRSLRLCRVRSQRVMLKWLEGSRHRSTKPWRGTKKHAYLQYLRIYLHRATVLHRQEIRDNQVVRTVHSLRNPRLPVAVRSQVVAFIGECFEVTVISAMLSQANSTGLNLFKWSIAQNKYSLFHWGYGLVV